MAHLKNTGLLINDDLLAVRILNGGVISFHKVIQAELNGQGGLSHSAVSENNQSVKHFLLEKQRKEEKKKRIKKGSDK